MHLGVICKACINLAAQPISEQFYGTIGKRSRGRIYSRMVRLQVQDTGKKPHSFPSVVLGSY